MTVRQVSASVSVTLAAVTVRGSGRVIANFAYQHLASAVLFRDKARDVETAHAGEEYGSFHEEIRAYASACVFCAAASLESFLGQNKEMDANAARQDTRHFHNDGLAAVRWRH
jgi:hypothetical protein